MTEDPKSSNGAQSEADEEALGEEETSELRSLLKNALVTEQPEDVDVLSSVQTKLRVRSGGKFYGDGWSTSKAPPISTYLITSLLMLAVVIVVYAVLAPLSGEPADIDTTPQPVHVGPILGK